MSKPAKDPKWSDICPLQQVPTGGLKPVLADGKRLLVARPVDGDPAVLDNRCPHEGYPLSQGSLDGTLLTCRWHNWKFQVHDGRCVMGGEDAPHWPTRVVGDMLQADLRGPDPALATPPLLESLATGVLAHDNGRAVRDGLRLLGLGLSPRSLLLHLAALDARHGEWGATHALPVAADCARLLERRQGSNAPDGQGLTGPWAMLAVAPVIDLCGEADARRPPRARAPALDFTGWPALREAVEHEDVARAQGLLGGALATGMPWSSLRLLLLCLQCEHFTSFGHPLIYTVKAAAWLRDDDDPDLVGDVAHGLLDSLLFSTREDTLPYWGRYQRRLEGWLPELERWWSRQPAEPGDATRWDGAPLRDAVLDGSADQACDQLERALREGVPAPRIAAWLVAAAAWRVLRFDLRHDRDPGVAEGWIWVTHRFTFAAAVRQAMSFIEGPQALRLLHQTLAFTHSGQPMDDQRETSWADPGRTPPGQPPVTPAGAPADGAPDAPSSAEVDRAVSDVLRAIADKRPDQAVASSAALLRNEPSVAALRQALEDLCLADPVVRPIVVAHVIKTTLAAFEERAALTDLPDRDVPVLAAVRLLSSPVVERQLAELVGSSIEWVVNGKPPRKLTQ